MKKMGLEQYKYSLQHASGMIVLQKTEKSINFIEEWLKFNLIDEAASLGYINDDTKNHNHFNNNFWMEEHINKSGHRNDQSIFSLLTKKYKIFSEASLFSVVEVLRNRTGKSKIVIDK
jgi:hypothetical protein